MNAIRTDCHVAPCRRAARRAAAGPPQLHILVDTSCRASFMPCGAGRDLEDPREMRFKTFTLAKDLHAPSGTRPVVYHATTGSRANYVTYAVDAGFRIRLMESNDGLENIRVHK